LCDTGVDGAHLGLMRTIIAGGRDYQFTPEDIEWLDRYHKTYPLTEVVCGGASGADECGKQWAKSRGIPVKMFPADWAQHGKAAGPLRNQQMAEYAEALFAFPGERETADMIRRAKAAGLSISIIQFHP